MTTSRIAGTFARLRAENRAALVTFVMSGDPDYAASLALVKALPGAGADLIELGMAFSDPTADGPAIQESGLRALKAGMTLQKTLQLARSFREIDASTPLVLMGYYNPICRYGLHRFASDAAAAGVDGVIVVDLPPEEDEEFRVPAHEAGLDFIRLATPTTDQARMPQVLGHASGFVYYVAVAGTTGSKSAAAGTVELAVARMRAGTDLPIAVGFGIRTPDQAAEVARVADAVVVGTAIVERMAGSSGADLQQNVLALVRDLAQGVRQARTS